MGSASAPAQIYAHRDSLSCEYLTASTHALTCWPEQGVRGMRVGGQRKLILPPNLVRPREAYLIDFPISTEFQLSSTEFQLGVILPVS
jgi:hypothetical protein